MTTNKCDFCDNVGLVVCDNCALWVCEDCGTETKCLECHMDIGLKELSRSIAKSGIIDSIADIKAKA